MDIINKDEQNLLNLMKEILEEGETRADRTGVGVKSVLARQLRYSLLDFTLPAITTKQTFIRGGVEETIFFIKGERQTKVLSDKGINIWKLNTTKDFLEKRGLSHYEEGDMGVLYGVNWRKFGSNGNDPGIDQLKNALHLIKTDPTSRRIMVSAHNPHQSHLGVLEPCHTFFQFYVSEGKYLSCHLFMRSNDLFLGHSLNIVGYAILTHLMAKAAGLEAKELIYTGSDIHIYLNHIDQVKEQISRTPYPFPKLEILKPVSTIEDMEKLTFEDFRIIDYKCHPAIKAPMAV